MSRYKLETKTPPKDNQDAFDRVWRRMIVKQYPIAKNKLGECVYRTGSGNACAMGYMMPPRTFREMEGQPIRAVVRDNPEAARWFRKVGSGLLALLQNVHDDSEDSDGQPVPLFRTKKRLRAIAKQYNLKVRRAKR